MSDIKEKLTVQVEKINETDCNRRRCGGDALRGSCGAGRRAGAAA